MYVYKRLNDPRRVFNFFFFPVFVLPASDGAKVLETVGVTIIQECRNDRQIRALKSLGGNMYHFLTTLDGVHDVLQMGEDKVGFVETLEVILPDFRTRSKVSFGWVIPPITSRIRAKRKGTRWPRFRTKEDNPKPWVLNTRNLYTV